MTRSFFPSLRDQPYFAPPKCHCSTVGAYVALMDFTRSAHGDAARHMLEPNVSLFPGNRGNAIQAGPLRVVENAVVILMLRPLAAGQARHSSPNGFGARRRKPSRQKEYRTAPKGRGRVRIGDILMDKWLDFVEFMKPVFGEYAVKNSKKPEYIKIHSFQTGWMPENPVIEE